MSTALELEAYLCDALTASNHDRGLVATGLNEWFSKLGADHRVPYIDDEPADDEPTGINDAA